MARPERRDCDYFPFYAKDGRTLHILEGKYDCKGSGFFTNVMRFLTLQEDHHFCIADEADRMYFFSKCRCDEQSGMDMLEIMSKTRKIHTHLWVSYKVIVSQDLLDSLDDAYRNRKNDIITIDEILVSYGSNTQEPVVSYAGNPQEPVVSDTENPQRKGKERKGKERKGKDPPTPLLEIDIDQQEKINGLCHHLETENIFPGVVHFVNEMISERNINPKAIIHALEKAKIKKTFDDTRGGAKAYCMKIIIVEDGNYNEAEHIKNHRKLKTQSAAL